MNWLQLGNQLKNSVLQLIVTKAIYNPSVPYKMDHIKEITGSGFIIDIKRGYVLTTANVVSDAITIMGKISNLGKRILSLEIISICREKNLAICKIFHDDIQLITRNVKNTKIFNVVFGDNMNLKIAEKVMIIGYQEENKNISYNEGTVIGFGSKDLKNTQNKTNTNNIEDSKQRKPSTVEISVYNKKGNEGGPLINDQGKVVGVVLFDEENQNSCQAIPTRTFLSIYKTMTTNNIVNMPTMSLEWNSTNSDLIDIKSGVEGMYGIYVRGILPDSFLDVIQQGDIIKKLEYKDSFWAYPESFNLKNYNNNIDSPVDNIGNKEKTPIDIKCYFDRYGDLQIKTIKNNKFVNLCNRKLSLSEVVDMIPINSKIKLEIYRNKKGYALTNNHISIESNRLEYNYKHINKTDYEIFAGLCCANLDMSHVDYFDNLNNNLSLYKIHKYQYTNKVVICSVFPDTCVYKTQSIKPGQIINRINQKPIKNLEDIRQILRTSPEILEIETDDKTLFVVQTINVVNEDLKLLKNFNIKHKYLLNQK